MTISQVHFSSRSRSNILNFPGDQVPVVRKVDSVIPIHHYPLDSGIGFPILIHWMVIYPVDSAIQGLNSGNPGPVDNFCVADKFFVSEVLILITMVKIDCFQVVR